MSCHAGCVHADGALTLLGALIHVDVAPCSWEYTHFRSHDMPCRMYTCVWHAMHTMQMEHLHMYMNAMRYAMPCTRVYTHFRSHDTCVWRHAAGVHVHVYICPHLYHIDVAHLYVYNMHLCVVTHVIWHTCTFTWSSCEVHALWHSYGCHNMTCICKCHNILGYRHVHGYNMCDISRAKCQDMLQRYVWHVHVHRVCVRFARYMNAMCHVSCGTQHVCDISRRTSADLCMTCACTPSVCEVRALCMSPCVCVCRHVYVYGRYVTALCVSAPILHLCVADLVQTCVPCCRVAHNLASKTA